MIAGVVSVGLVPNTNAPVPVSSEITPANSAEVVAAWTESLSVVTTRVLLVGIVEPLIEVAVATPSTGVTRVGEVANTREPLPVSSEMTPANSAEVVAANTEILSVVTTRVLLAGIVEPLIEVAVATPKTGVTSVGEVAKTRLPLPVSSVTAVIKFALDGVAKNVATPAASPLTPELIGWPVAFVSVADVGVPSIGVVSVGDVAKTNAPVPVSSVTALMRFALDGVVRNVATPAASPLTPELIGRPVALVNVPEVGVPSNGVTNVGDVANTRLPVPVSSLITPASAAEVVAAKDARVLATVVIALPLYVRRLLELT